MFPAGFRDLATPGDIAAAGLGYIIGFVFGFFVPIGETEPGVIAGVFAVGVIAIKALLQIILGRFQARKDHEKLEESCRDFVTTLRDKGVVKESSTAYSTVGEDVGLDSAGLAKFWGQHELWEKGLLGDEDFKTTLNEMASRYRYTPPERSLDNALQLLLDVMPDESADDYKVAEQKVIKALGEKKGELIEPRGSIYSGWNAKPPTDEEKIY